MHRTFSDHLTIETSSRMGVWEGKRTEAISYIVADVAACGLDTRWKSPFIRSCKICLAFSATDRSIVVLALSIPAKQLNY